MKIITWILLFIKILNAANITTKNGTVFTQIILKRKALKMVLLGQCEEVTKHDYQKSGDCPCDSERSYSSSYVTKLESLVTLACFSVRYQIRNNILIE